MGRDRLSFAGELGRGVGAVGSIAVEGSVVFLARDGLAAVDVSDPAAPREIGRLETRRPPISLAVAGQRAFVGTASGVEVIDVARPDALRHLGVVGGDAAYGLAADGERLLVGDRERLHAWTVPADPAAARRRGQLELDLAGRIALDGDRAFVAADMEGMVAVDVADLERPTRLGEYEGLGDVTRVALAGARAVVADYVGGLAVVDATNPRRLRQLGTWTEGMVGDVAVRGDRAFVAMGDLVVVDLTDPRRPREIGRHRRREGDTAWGVELVGDVVCAVGGAGLSLWRDA